MIENEEQKKYLENIMTQIEGGKILSEIVSGSNIKIKRLLFEECGERGRKALILDFERTTPISEILQLYGKRVIISEIDKALGLPKGKANELIAKYETLTGKKFQTLYNGIRYDFDEHSINEEIFLKYKKGKREKEKTSFKQLAEEYHVSTTVIRNIIEKYMIDHNIDKEELEEKESNIKFKNAARGVIKNILSKYNYTYEELNEEALKVGYFVQRDIYDSVIEELNKKRKGEDR